MVLQFNPTWRFEPPPDGTLLNSRIPHDAVEEFLALIYKVATQGDRQEILEDFKGHLCKAVGTTHVWSSSASWAETDLRSYMFQAADNAPLFIEAFVDACETLRKKGLFAPDAAMINEVLVNHRIGYEVRPPDLVLRDTALVVVEVPPRPPTLAEQSAEIFQKSLSRSEELLAEGRGREAVQEILWLLESTTTAFRGVDTGTGTIEGKYFNQIARELRGAGKGTTLETVIGWLTALHGYLSSPTGGAVRHGLDLKNGVEISLNEARLFCNLVRSYLGFLLAEHERLVRAKSDS
jgi:hypothetical protein